MILSALLTSVGINLGLCFLFFTLYSILRKQPCNASVYAPRLLAERESRQKGHFNLERFLPSASWVRRAWQLSDDELLSTSGLDAVVFTRIFIFSLKVFSVAAIIGIFILLPLNYMGNQPSLDFNGVQDKTLESFTISNVDNGSKWLWIHFCAVYVFTGIVCCLLYLEYAYISSKRMAYFYASGPEPRQFTVLVRSIPVTTGRSVSETVESFFKEYYPSTYLSHSVVRRTNRLRKLIKNADTLYCKLVRLRSENQTGHRFKRSGFLGLFGCKIDLLHHYEKKLGDMQENMRTEQSSVAVQEVPAAFVSFKTRLGAELTLHIRQGTKPTEWVTERAPDPQDVYWPFFSASFIKRWVCSLVVIVATIILTVLFLIPVVIVQGLTNLERLEALFPFLETILRTRVICQVITGWLPSFILDLFQSFVPPIMIMFSCIQGYIALSQIQKSACIKVLYFTLWNAFFANVLSGSVLYRFDVILEPKIIPALLAVAVPGQACFFIAYVVTSGWTSISSELFRPMALISSFIKKKFCWNSQGKIEVPSIPYHSETPKVLFFGLLGVTYFFLAPLILPFLLVYYCLGYIIYRNQLLTVYAPKFETGGKFWPVVHESTVFSLVLMHIIAIGIFGLKKLSLASSFVLPLPVLTLVFNSYCHRRFLPIFKAYPAEGLIKKDKDDQSDPTISSFYEKLTTAYQDPALMPVQYSGNSERITSPLLHATEP